MKGRLRTGVYAEMHPFAWGPLYLQDAVSLCPLLPALKCTGNKRPPRPVVHGTQGCGPRTRGTVTTRSQRAVLAGGTYAPAHTVPSVTYVWGPGASGPHREDLELLTAVGAQVGSRPAVRVGRSPPPPRNALWGLRHTCQDLPRPWTLHRPCWSSSPQTQRG